MSGDRAESTKEKRKGEKKEKYVPSFPSIVKEKGGRCVKNWMCGEKKGEKRERKNFQKSLETARKEREGGRLLS